MHSIAEIGSNVPAFLGKLWKMVEDPVTNDLISWSSSGNSFVIKDEIRFARELLPMYYKHNNMASFIRQLNMYGFHKIVSPDAGSMKMESPEEIQFTHPCFIRGHAYMLENIKRKIGVSKVNIGTISGAGDKPPPQVLGKVLSDVRQMKGRQESMDGRLSAMKMENAALWRELSVLRQKHIKQQQIVNKLIQFLVSIVQQNQNSFSVKRKVFPRMLQHHQRPGKHHLDVQDCASSSETSPGGPVIHELDPTEALLEDVVEEAESITPMTETPEPDYFLDQHNDDGGEFEISSEPQSLNVNIDDTTDGETILGVPEDVLVINVNNQQKQNRSNKQYVLNSTSAPIIIPSASINSQEGAQPKIYQIVPKRPKKNETNLRIQPSQIVIPRPPPKQTVTTQILQRPPPKQTVTTQILQRPSPKQTVAAQPKVNNKGITNRNLMLNSRRKNPKKTQLKKLNLNLQGQKLAGASAQSQETVKNENKTIKAVPANSSSYSTTDQVSRSAQLVNSNSLLKPDQGAVSTQQLITNNYPTVNVEQGSTLVQPQAIAPTQVITVPFDSGACETILPDAGIGTMDSLILPVESEDFSMPVTAEAVLPNTSPVVASPDPVLTPCPTNPSPSFLPPPDHTPSPSRGLQLACMDDSQVPHSPSLLTRDEMDNHLESVESDLDSLKELLRSEGISLDANALLGCFNEDPLSYNIMTNPGSEQDQLKENSGNELIAYNPSLFDLADLMGNDWNLPSPGAQQPTDDMFAEIHTPQFVPHSPSYPTPAKKRKT